MTVMTLWLRPVPSDPALFPGMCTVCTLTLCCPPSLQDGDGSPARISTRKRSYCMKSASFQKLQDSTPNSWQHTVSCPVKDSPIWRRLVFFCLLSETLTLRKTLKLLLKEAQTRTTHLNPLNPRQAQHPPAAACVLLGWCPASGWWGKHLEAGSGSTTVKIQHQGN